MSNIQLISKEQIRALLYYDYKNGVTANNSCDNINSKFGKGSLVTKTTYNWNSKFKKGDSHTLILMLLIKFKIIHCSSQKIANQL